MTVIPNPLPLQVFTPFPTGHARQSLGLPKLAPLVLFGADGGIGNPLKGFDMLERSMERLVQTIPDIEIVVFGQDRPANDRRRNFPIHWLGRIDDDHRLALAYSACNVMVVPSRQESFGQTGTEAQACGTPVVAFRNTGLEDIVGHRDTGYLADQLVAEDLTNAIQWVLKHPNPEALSRGARRRAEATWSPDIVAKQYMEVYELAIMQQEAALAVASSENGRRDSAT